MAEVIIVPLRHEHLEQFHGVRGRGPTVKGVAGFVDGELVAVAGLAIVAGHIVAFCDMRDGARPYRTAIHRTAIRFLNEAKAKHRRIVATCDENEPTAPKWLKRLGFVPDENGEWVWQAS